MLHTNIGMSVLLRPDEVRIYIQLKYQALGKSLRFYGTSLDVKNFLKGSCVLVSSGNYTHVEILTGNS